MTIPLNALRLTLLVCAATMTVLTGGCGQKKVAVQAALPQQIDQQDRLEESLFKGDTDVLSNTDIERILSARVTTADRHRMAVLGLGSRSVWSPALAELETQNSTRLLETLGGAGQLTQVRMMPALLIPEKRTVPYLREAAARFQADLLLIYATRIQNYQRGRLIGDDEVRAACMAESVLLDVRTGIVAHTARSAEAIDMKKATGDLNFSETVAKAESEATGRALVKLAESVVSYLRDGK
ncbi:MAG TPA: hypothetical protein VFB85_13775 [Vicinamibacterales bacterium]|jgi:hypothetical protein|nr:hypothetical protein [Vicinamibacterales bacterium]